MYEVHKVPQHVLDALQQAAIQTRKKYPFSKMAVGDAFLVYSGDDVAKVKSAARAHMSRTEMRFLFVPADGGATSIVRVS